MTANLTVILIIRAVISRENAGLGPVEQLVRLFLPSEVKTACARPQLRQTQPQEYKTNGIQLPREETGMGTKCSLARTSFLLQKQAGGQNKHLSDGQSPQLVAQVTHTPKKKIKIKMNK